MYRRPDDLHVHLRATMTIAAEKPIQSAYSGKDLAKSYVAERFVSEIGRLLHERQVAVVNRIMDDIQPTDCLEIAPGPGRLTRDIRPCGGLTCLEYNEGMIAEGKAACSSSVEWVQGNAFELPFAGEEFDFVYSFRFVRHFKRIDRQRLHAQIHRVLRPGGIFVFDAVNRVVSGPLREADPDAYPIYDKLYRDEQELRTELSEAGFQVIEIEPVQRWYSAQYRAQIWLGPRSRWLARRTIRLLERLRRGPALEWIVTCRRA